MDFTAEEKQRIKDYASDNGYAEHVIHGGIPWLVANWQDTTDSRLEQEEYTLDEYLNDLDARRVIDELELLLGQPSFQQLDAIVTPIDERFLERTYRIAECLWGKRAEKKNGYNPSTHWYYYRLPLGRSTRWITKS
jgi:hypothetical protein